MMMMGSEFGQWNEWHYEQSLDWHLLSNEENQKLSTFFKAANAFYLEQKELWELDFSWEGFQWVSADDNSNNCASFLRKSKNGDTLLVVCNFSPIRQGEYRLGAPFRGDYRCIFNADDIQFGGSGVGNHEVVTTQDEPSHGFDQSLVIDLPPMSGVIYRCVRKKPARKKTALPAKKAVERKVSTKKS